MNRDNLNNGREPRYRIRFLAALALAELLLLALFKFVPPIQESVSREPAEQPGKVTFQQVEITRHTDQPASPPRPVVPLQEPEEEIIEEDIDVDPLQQAVALPEDIGVGFGKGDTGGAYSGEPVKNPERPPSLYKIVEPEMPKEAIEANIKAVIEVRFLINADGVVEEASIARIKLFGEDSGEYKLVDNINYGLTRATLNAALQWKFHPAEKNGKKVPAYSIHSFTYGF